MNSLRIMLIIALAIGIILSAIIKSYAFLFGYCGGTIITIAILYYGDKEN